MAPTIITPMELEGEVVKGFGRGSKELGIPTANFPEDVVDNLPESVSQGIYYGWAQVNKGPVYMAVMSVGWNPYYKNTKKSAEVHILHQFEDDFYGETMRMLVLGHIRPERNFDSLEALIAAINEDIRMTKEALANSEDNKSNFFQQNA
eukprot:TRINITY_DN9876_c0_g1_i5.p1 TRINITY_DN9876_c0_g1~~TRINITY_DN9876_c0_g1_i5.p1  ORF type:complete len:149 (+),score=18.61 TRINITY_DN9876_c0_g1_i5:177-623(+)